MAFELCGTVFWYFEPHSLFTTASFGFVAPLSRPSNWLICSPLARFRFKCFPARHGTPPTGLALLYLLQVLAYEANIEAAVLAQDAGTTPLPEDYTQFIPKACTTSILTSVLKYVDGYIPSLWPASAYFARPRGFDFSARFPTRIPCRAVLCPPTVPSNTTL